MNTAFDQNVSMLIPESKKDKEYHRQMAEFIISGRMNWGQRINVPRYWNLYHGTYDIRAENAYLMTTERGDALPVDYAHMNFIFKNVQLALDGIIKRGIEAHVTPHSRSALNRRRSGQLDIQTDYNLFPFYLDQQEKTGLPVVPPGIPGNEESLQFAMENYKEMGQLVNERMIDHHIREQKLLSMNILLYEQALVAGSCHVKSTLINGRRYTEMLKSQDVVWDTYANDPFLSNAWCIGHYEYLGASDLETRFNMDRSEIGALGKEMEKNGSRINLQGGSFLASSIGNGTGKRYLVTTVYWKDLRRKKGQRFVAKNGVPHFHVKDYYVDRKDRSRPEQEIMFDSQMVRQAVVVGGVYVPEGHYGVIPFQARPASHGWNKADFPIASYVPRMNGGRFIPTMELIYPVQKQINKVHILINKATGKDRGKVNVMDEALRESDAGLFDALFEMEHFGIERVNSRQHGIQSQASLPAVKDMSLSPTFGFYVQLHHLYTGVMETLLLGSQGQRSQVASEIVSEKSGISKPSETRALPGLSPIVHGFHEFWSRLFGVQLQQDRWLLTKNPDRYSDIIGDDGVRFIASDLSFHYDAYGLFVNMDAVREEDRQILMGYLAQAINAQTIDPMDAAGILLSRDRTPNLIKEIQDKQRKAKEEARQYEMDMQQMQAAMAEQDRAFTIQSRNEEWRYNQAMAEMDRAGKLQELAQQAKARENEIRLKVQGDLEKARLQQTTSYMRDRMKIANS